MSDKYNAAKRQEQEALRVMQEAAAALDHVSAERDRYREALESIELSASASQGNASDRFASIRRTVREALAREVCEREGHLPEEIEWYRPCRRGCGESVRPKIDYSGHP